jgi:hypothetical protein
VTTICSAGRGTTFGVHGLWVSKSLYDWQPLRPQQSGCHNDEAMVLFSLHVSRRDAPF